MQTQDRTITLGEYRFTEGKRKHLHELMKNGEWKPLTGVTTILGMIAKPNLYQWYANRVCDYIEKNCELVLDTTKNLEPSHYIVPVEELEEARNCGKNTKESAGEWGTKVHAKIEEIINKAISESEGYIQLNEYVQYIEQDTPESKSIQHFLDWAIPKGVKFLASEKHVYSKSMWVGGIADIICEIDGKRFVGDVKTSSGIYPEAFIQCSAYAQMLLEMGEYKNEIVQTTVEGTTLPKGIEMKPAFDGVVILNLKKDGTFDYKYNYDIEGNFECFQAALTIYRQLNYIK